uniref:Transposase, YhgA-like n=1 Tax=Candidatus Kentrum sp. DK TaxID=2126562 RepID=A0A450TFH9_9GAMM|nr:MAG: hypothetical protein BECKDK2373B_GA0170837_11566 [Candidatus Kentron sp. DK]
MADNDIIGKKTIRRLAVDFANHPEKPAMTEDQQHQPLRDDYDGPWKEALKFWFPEFLALLFPAIHGKIDWSRQHEFLDKELQQVAWDAKFGRRYADKLVKVWTLAGKETWVLIHVEVQGQPEPGFDERMYVYNYRLFDRYRVDVVSLAVLADQSPGFRAGDYRRDYWGCDVRFSFPTVKLLDLARDWASLEKSDNPFALVVMAHLMAISLPKFSEIPVFQGPNKHIKMV